MLKKIETILIFIIIGFLSLTLLLQFFNIKTKVVQSDSMYPVIRVNDLVYINENYTNYKVGDIISFNLSSNEVLHRIVEINGSTVITKGDNNTTLDEPITRTNINGKYLFKLPYGGLLLNINLWIILIGLYGVIFVSRLIIKEFRKA